MHDLLVRQQRADGRRYGEGIGRGRSNRRVVNPVRPCSRYHPVPGRSHTMEVLRLEQRLRHDGLIPGLDIPLTPRIEPVNIMVDTVVELRDRNSLAGVKWRKLTGDLLRILLQA